MIPQLDLDEFYAGKRSLKIPFVVNDAAEVTDGSYKGRACAVICPETLGEQPTFLVEFGDDGSSAVLPAEILRRIQE